jgi:hypothetical protein
MPNSRDKFLTSSAHLLILICCAEMRRKLYNFHLEQASSIRRTFAHALLLGYSITIPVKAERLREYEMHISRTEASQRVELSIFRWLFQIIDLQFWFTSNLLKVKLSLSTWTKLQSVSDSTPAEFDRLQLRLKEIRKTSVSFPTHPTAPGPPYDILSPLNAFKISMQSREMAKSEATVLKNTLAV